MVRVYDRLYVGDLDDFQREADGMAVVSATQTAHYSRMGWSRSSRPSKDDPDYLYREEGDWLSLNWVDGGAHLYSWSGPELFSKTLDFIDRWRGKGVLVHCDQGLSRSPTVALLWLAKRAQAISSASFGDAMRDFLLLYPAYSPGGIADYVESNWELIR